MRDIEGMGDFSRIEQLLADDVLSALLADPAALRRLRVALREIEATEAVGPVPAYTVDSLAAVLSVTPRVVRNAVARGELRAVKRGGRWLIPADAVVEWTHGDISRSSAGSGRRGREVQPASKTRSTASARLRIQR